MAPRFCPRCGAQQVGIGSHCGSCHQPFEPTEPDPERWLADVPLEHVRVDQCRRCGALVVRWVPVISDPDQRSTLQRHEDWHRAADRDPLDSELRTD